MRVTLIAALLVAATLARGVEPAIADKDLVPGGEITVELPNLGESGLSAELHPKKPEMVAMQARLPSNWDRKRPMPVLCVYRGWDGSGNAFQEWNKLMGGVNFITLTVDYNASGNDAGFVNMVYALRVLEKATAIDRSSLVVAGDGGGAWMVASQFASDRTFCAAVVLGGGDPVDARALAGRPMLIVANADDGGGKNDSQPLSNYERQLALYDGIRKGGGSAELIVAEKLWNWADAYGPRIKDWIHQVVPNPEIKRAYWLDHELGTTQNDDRLRWLWQQFADTWVEMPRSAEAKKKLNAATK